MKKIYVLTLIVVCAGIFMFAGCNSDETEVAWVNDSSSDVQINEIVWANGDQVWNNSSGWGDGGQTEAKTVTQKDGSIVTACSDNSDNPQECTVKAREGNDFVADNTSLNEGESQVVTLQVLQAK